MPLDTGKWNKFGQGMKQGLKQYGQSGGFFGRSPSGMLSSVIGGGFRGAFGRKQQGIPNQNVSGNTGIAGNMNYSPRQGSIVQPPNSGVNIGPTEFPSPMPASGNTGFSGYGGGAGIPPITPSPIQGGSSPFWDTYNRLRQPNVYF